MTSKFTATVSQITLTHQIIGSQGQASPWLIRCCPGSHFDAIYNRADAETQSTACASVSNGGQVGFGIKLDSLQTEIRSIDVTVHKGQECPHFSSDIFLHGSRATPGQEHDQCSAVAVATAELPKRREKRKKRKKFFSIRNTMFKIPQRHFSCVVWGKYVMTQ